MELKFHTQLDLKVVFIMSENITFLYLTTLKISGENIDNLLHRTVSETPVYFFKCEILQAFDIPT